MPDVTTDEREALIAELLATAGQSDDPNVQRVCNAAIAALRTQAAPRGEAPKPFLWLRTLNGEPDWAEDCVSPNHADLFIGEYPEEDGYAAMPLFAAPPVAPQASEPVAPWPPADWRLTFQPSPFRAEKSTANMAVAPDHVTGPAGIRFLCYNAWDVAQQLNALYTAAAPQALHAGPPREPIRCDGCGGTMWEHDALARCHPKPAGPPREPTPEMQKAMLDAMFADKGDCKLRELYVIVRRGWRAGYDAWQAQQEPQE